ncbi:hypothetical protein P280DRAFT_150446 [Massarina eburnea CBS 473.64]|uniref:Uncharacterized protein n=1 Tax=Massarina eburnea CBS 473.64 TaxID=1395130 RepID=A0A6A6RMB6_9PLEO|nr:hypothetical protein P280DRAFT_150446 [Massarina eburnea CBS 473.64]
MDVASLREARLTCLCLCLSSRQHDQPAYPAWQQRTRLITLQSAEHACRQSSVSRRRAFSQHWSSRLSIPTGIAA